MLDVLKIAAVLAAIILLLKRRWSLGIVMALSSLFLAILYLLSPMDYLRAFAQASSDAGTISLVIVLTFIRIFENIMRKSGIMQEMMNACKGLIVDRRILMASMPALIGLLPSMGGALFSAPMVEEASQGTKATPERKAFVNYLFRHPWEFISPLYPGIILASAITSYPVRDLIIVNLPQALFLIAGGIIWGLAGMGACREGFRKVSRRGLLSFLPLFLIIIMVVLFRIDLSLTLGAVILGLYALLGYSMKRIAESIREGFSWEIMIIIIGVMTFKAVLVSSGAVANISAFFAAEGIPLLPVLFLLPFIAGILTGLTVGFVGATFPILWGLESAHHPGAVSFAFAAGYVGVLLSPVHLCLLLTREYFNADMSGVYSRIIRAGMLIIAAALAEYIILVHY